MSSFDQLDPLLRHHIVNSLGWRALRPLQEASIGPILSGSHSLVIAETAGGKTEAAVLPLLSRLCSSSWPPISILYVCPLRALLNNLYERLDRYTGLLGRRCEVWHGDVAASRKKAIRSDPPDLLLTTPESLEVMLISKRSDMREPLKNVRAVVVDEIHAFAGDDRGWHLLALLERICRLSGREIQRVGLSATVGNPGELLSWLSGHCEGKREVVCATGAGPDAADVTLDFVGSLDNAAIVISRLHRGEKRLVFCDSRSRVEDLSGALRRLGVSVYVSHSSLSAEDRRASETAFASSHDCVIVATSTLELGIDVGDLDRVIQIDAPRSVASFLQRLGRTGRRGGKTRNCLVLATHDLALMASAAILRLWEDRYVEPIVPPADPFHVLSQQLMALALQEGGIGRRDWHDWIGRLPAFAHMGPEEQGELIEHLTSGGYLFEDSGRLSLGTNAEAAYGRRNFLELLSVFTSQPMFTVRHGNRDLGVVDQITFSQPSREGPKILCLGGRNWEISSLDWSRRIAYVVPSREKGKSQWTGAYLGMSYRITRAVHGILASDGISPRWSSRARERLDNLRSDFAFLDKDRDVAVRHGRGGETRWYTFAGAIINRALADCLRKTGLGPADGRDFFVRCDAPLDATQLNAFRENLTATQLSQSLEIDDDFLDNLKFHETLPRARAVAILRKRMAPESEIKEVLTKSIKITST